MSIATLETSSSVPFPDGSAPRSRDKALIRLLAAAAAAFDSDSDRAKACVQQAAELVRVSLEREGYPGNEPVSRRCLARWQANRVAAYIESNIGLALHVADLAALVQLSISHFSRSFAASFGQPPCAYIRIRRIRHAQLIMLSSREPLSQIALDCGMNDQAHFTRVFHKIVGVTPGLWRRQFQSEPTSTRPVRGAATASEACLSIPAGPPNVNPEALNY